MSQKRALAFGLGLLGLLALAPRAFAGAPCREPGELSDVVSCMTDPEDWEHVSCDTRCRKDYCVAVRNDTPMPRLMGDWCLLVTDRQGTVTGSVSLPEGGGATVSQANEAGDIDVRVRSEGGSVATWRFKRRKDGSLAQVSRPPEREPQRVAPAAPPPPKPTDASCSRSELDEAGAWKPPTCRGRKPTARFLQEAARVCRSSGEEPADAGTPPSGVGACSASACVAVVPFEETEETEFCLAGQAKGGAVHRLRLNELANDSSGFQEVGLTGATACATFVEGGGSGGDIVSDACVLIGTPDRVPMPSASRVSFQNDEGYQTVVMKTVPTLDGDIANDAAWAPVQPLPAKEASSVVNGLSAWEGPRDASVTWRLGQAPDALYLAAQVDDDKVTPAVPGMRAAVADHLELRPYYAVVLEPDGRASVRQWRDRRGTRVDWPVRGAECRWKPREGGQDIECRLPFGAVGALLAPPSRNPFWLVFSDGDGGPRQKSQMGTRVDLWLWKELPPTVDDYLSAKRGF